MSTQPRRVFTFANIVSSLALLIAVSTGTAYAANTIFSTDIVDGEVKSGDLDTGAVKSGKIAAGAVSRNKIANGAVNSPKIATGAVNGAKILDATIGLADLGTDSVGSFQIMTNGVGALEVQDHAIGGGEIIDNSVGAADLATNSVGSSKIATGAVDSAKILNNTITANDIKGGDSAGAISVSAGGVANGRCEDLNVGVPGAAVNEAVVFSVRASVPEGMLFYGVRVSAAGNVVLKVCNFTGGTSPAISNLPVRVMTFG